MQLDKSVRICDLFDIYGNLLSKKQQAFIKDYYFLDNSLAEIAQLNSISRQAVLDSLKKSEKKLEEFENSLKLLEIKKQVLKLKDNNQNKEIIQNLKKLI